MNIQIRTALPHDIPVLVEHNCLMALETENKTLSQEVVSPGVEGLFSRPERGFYLIAEIEGETAGSLMVTYEWSDWRNGDMWWFQSVFVREKFRGKGVFRKMYEKVATMAKSAGAKGLRLYVEKENTGAQKVYEQMGMHETHYLMYENSF